MFIKSVFGTVFITTIFPCIAMSVEKKDKKETNGFVGSTIERMMFFIVPITVGCMIIAEEIVSIIYKRGAFSDQSVLLTSECLKWYAIGLPAFCIRDLLVKVFYANKDSKTPTYNMFIGIGINVILNFVLAYFFGLKGLAMASSIAAYVIMILLAINVHKKDLFKVDSATLAKLVKITASSLLMLVCICFVKTLLAVLPVVASVCLMVAVGLMTYCVFLLLFRTYTPKTLLKRIIMK